VTSTAVAVTEAASTHPAAASPWTRTSIRFGPRFIDIQRPPAHIRAIQRRYCPFRFPLIRHFHERKAPRPSGLPVGHDAHPFYRAISFKEGSYRLFANTKIEVAYKNIFQVFSLRFEIRLFGADTETNRVRCKRSAELGWTFKYILSVAAPSFALQGARLTAGWDCLRIPSPILHYF
jgi:hypothetical protein